MQPQPSQDEIETLRACVDNFEKDTQRFLEHVVHDLRTARRAVGISVEVLLGGLPTEPDEEFQKTVQHLRGGLTKMDAILAGVSNYCLSLRTSAYSFEDVSSQMMVRLAAGSLDQEIRQAGAKVNYDGLPHVVGDRDLLTRLFRNLIDNALKYRGAAPPQIEIRAARIPGNWRFSVKDNGIGIDEKYREGIFAPFTRLHGSEIPGAGLGLAICKKIVDAHHGTIHIESVVGSETTIFFTLPAEDGSARGDGP